MPPQAVAAATRGRPHAALPERRLDNWQHLHETFVREAREAGVAGRARCRILFLGDSITEAMRGTQFGETYDELKPRRKVFEDEFVSFGARAFGISGDRTQNLLWRIQNGELEFRHTPDVVCICIGTNNIGRDGDNAEDTFLGIYAVVQEVLHRLPGCHVALPGILPRGPAEDSSPASMLPGAPGVSSEYTNKDTGDHKYSQPGLYTPTIEEVNRRLAQFARDSDGCIHFIPCKQCFLKPDGSGIVAELMRDALHPTGKGMRAWFKVLKPALVQLVHAPPPTHAAVAPPLPRPEGQGQLGRQDAAAAAPATTRGPPAHRSRL